MSHPKLVPVPIDSLAGTAPFWLPFVQGIAKRSRCHPEQLIAQLQKGEVLLFIIWDDELKTSVAIAGTRFILRGDGCVAELIWMTGSNRKEWQHLIAELEAYHRDIGCVGFIARARPGWAPFLKSQGYRMTHMIFDKDF